MKKILFVLLLIVQNTVNAQTYYDADNNEIDKATFDKLKLNKKNMEVQNDSLNRFKLINFDERMEVGSLEDSSNLINTLNEKLNLKLDKNKPLIIYYYPGKDPCNSSGVFTKRKEMLEWDLKVDVEVRKIADVNVLRVYKNSEGIKTLKDHVWKKDPNALIENLFFNYHYPCGSFVVINKEKYAAFFGEYGYNEVKVNLAYLLKQ